MSLNLAVFKRALKSRNYNFIMALTSCSAAAPSGREWLTNKTKVENISDASCRQNFHHPSSYVACVSMVRNVSRMFTNVTKVGVSTIREYVHSVDSATSSLYDCCDHAHYLWWSSGASYSLLLQILSGLSEELLLCSVLLNRVQRQACDLPVASSLQEFASRHSTVVKELISYLSRLVWFPDRHLIESSGWNLTAIMGTCVVCQLYVVVRPALLA